MQAGRDRQVRVEEADVTALRNRSIDTMYRPGKIAGLIADLSVGIALIAVGAGVIAGALTGVLWL